MMEQFEKAADFIRNYSGRTTLVYDTDADGITGGAVVSRVLKKKFKKYPVSIPDNHSIPFITDATKHIYDRIVEEDTESLITVDVPVDQGLKYLMKLAEKMNILVVDHHQPRHNLNKLGKNIVHINPHFSKISIKPFNYCGSKLAYDICSQISDIENISWLTGAGIIGDYSGEVWKDFLDDVYKKHPSLKKGKNLYGIDSRLGEITSLINSGLNFSGSEGAKIAFDACLKASSPEDILQARKLRKFQLKVKEEVEGLTKDWESKAEIIEENNLIFYQLPTTMFVQPEVANRISHEKPDHTFILLKDYEDVTYLTLRRIDEKVNCGELARVSTKNLENAGGGGHIIAAGGRLMTKDKEVFKREVINLTKKH